MPPNGRSSSASNNKRASEGPLPVRVSPPTSITRLPLRIKCLRHRGQRIGVIQHVCHVNLPSSCRMPLHSKLIETGVLTIKDITDGPYLIPGLETSKQGIRDAALGRAFSLLKTRIDLPAEITFHSFRHTVSTQLTNADANIREVWIDRLLGHESTHKSQGTTTYLTGISTTSLLQTIEAISYPETAFKKGTF